MTICDAESWITAREEFWAASRLGTWQQRSVLKPALELVLACLVSGDSRLLEATGFNLDNSENLFPNLDVRDAFSTVSTVPMDIEMIAIISSIFEFHPWIKVVQGQLPLIRSAYKILSTPNKHRVRWSIKKLGFLHEIELSPPSFVPLPPTLMDQSSLYDFTHEVFHRSDFGREYLGCVHLLEFCKLWLAPLRELMHCKEDFDLAKELEFTEVILGLRDSPSVFEIRNLGVHCPRDSERIGPPMDLAFYDDDWHSYHPILVQYMIFSMLDQREKL